MSSWPASLPAYPLRDSVRETPQPQTIRSTVDAGPPKVRRRFTAGIDLIEMEFALTEAQYATLRTFHDTTVNGGADSFTMTHPRTEASITVRFAEPPAWRAVRGNARGLATVKVEKLP